MKKQNQFAYYKKLKYLTTTPSKVKVQTLNVLEKEG